MMNFDVGRLCCSEEQVVLLADYALYLTTCLLLWYSRALVPLKLFTVFLHELSHAIAVWLTCNRVTGIEVNANQGGVTHWTAPANRSACARCVVLPAGYLGSAAWGGLILVCCVRPDSTRAVALVLIVALLVALGYAFLGKSNAREWTLASLCGGMIVLLVGLLHLSYNTHWRYKDLLLSRVLLLIGTMNTLFATYDIWEDCVSRTVEGSDAYKFADLVRCAAPKCVGVIWLLMSMAMAFVMLAVALSWTGGGPDIRSGADLSRFSWLCIAAPAMVCVAAVVFRLLCSTTYRGRLAAPRKTRGLTSFEEEDDDEDPAEKDVECPELQDSTEESSDTTASSSEEVFFTTGTHAVEEAAAVR